MFHAQARAAAVLGKEESGVRDLDSVSKCSQVLLSLIHWAPSSQTFLITYKMTQGSFPFCTSGIQIKKCEIYARFRGAGQTSLTTVAWGTQFYLRRPSAISEDGTGSSWGPGSVRHWQTHCTCDRTEHGVL